MTELELRSKYVSTAGAYFGVTEGSAGHREIVDLYNSHKPLARGYKLKYTDAWCAGFVSAMAIEADLTAIIPTEVSCSKMIGLFQALGHWVEDDTYEPRPGDVIFYDWEDDGKGDNTGAPNHVGIVEEVSGGVIYVIEGNRDGNPDCVGSRKIAVGGRYIRGFGVPDYAALAREEVQEPEETKKEEVEMRYKTIEEVPGYAREAVQKLLDGGILLGKGGEEGLDLSEDMVRVLVMLDRAGLMHSDA